MKRLLVGACLLLATQPAAGSAQQVARGVHLYDVRGEGEFGSVMAPWQSQVAVRDTTVRGTAAVSLHYGSRANGSDWLFNMWTTLMEMPPEKYQARFTGRGQGGATACTTEVADRTVKTSAESAGPFDTPVVPEAALAFILSGVALKPNMNVRYAVFRCEEAGSMVTYKLNATVGEGKASRVAGGTPEDAWLVAGDSDYAFKAAIAKSDGAVLSFQIPQGASDVMIFQYRELRASK